VTRPEPTGDELPVFIMGPGREPERLMLVGRPSAGRVRIREWTGGDWSAPPSERDLPCAELADVVERAVRDGRSINQSPQTVRRWLDDARA
jgi:hypothetical protein